MQDLRKDGQLFITPSFTNSKASYKTSVVLTVRIGRQGDLQPHKAPTKQYASCSFLPKDTTHFHLLLCEKFQNFMTKMKRSPLKQQQQNSRTSPQPH